MSAAAGLEAGCGVAAEALAHKMPAPNINIKQACSPEKPHRAAVIGNRG